MFIRMLDTRRGCEDGFSVRRFYNGNVYDTDADGIGGIRHSLALSFIFWGYAEVVKPTVRQPAINPATNPQIREIL